jgi:RNA polymerase sigma factor (sigma-70 family)
LRENETHPICYAQTIYAKSVSPPKKAPAGNVGSSGAQSFLGDSIAYLDDYRLVQKALSDLQVTESVLRRVYPRIYEVVQSVVGRAQNLDDIAQLAALEVARCLDRYHGRGSIESWAAKIAYRKAARVIRREWKKKMATVPLDVENFPDDDTHNPEKLMSREQLFNIFLFKLCKIPLKRRVPLLLHVLYGYTIREVSELTEISANTVKDRLKTASREFRSILEQNPSLVTAILEELS